MFRRALKAFLPNEQNKEMFPLFVCFSIGVLGFAIGFLNDDTPHMWLRVGAVAMVLLGLFGGFCLLLYELGRIVWRLIRTVSGKQ